MSCVFYPVNGNIHWHLCSQDFKAYAKLTLKTQPTLTNIDYIVKSLTTVALISLSSKTCMRAPTFKEMKMRKVF